MARDFKELSKEVALLKRLASIVTPQYLSGSMILIRSYYGAVEAGHERIMSVRRIERSNLAVYENDKRKSSSRSRATTPLRTVSCLAKAISHASKSRVYLKS